jgi:hypothetical protein
VQTVKASPPSLIINGHRRSKAAVKKAKEGRPPQDLKIKAKLVPAQAGKWFSLFVVPTPIVVENVCHSTNSRQQQQPIDDAAAAQWTKNE